jgi:hypothetical protein
MLFRVTVVGIGFRKTVDGVEGRYGFLTYRFADAATPEAAIEAAVRSVADRAELRDQLDGAQLEPRFAIEEVVAADEAPPTELGLIWYPDPAPQA